MENILRMTPAVFAVGKTYQIIVLVDASAMMWVEVNGECYYDDSNGILRSSKNIHKMSVPQNELDDAKKYTVCYRKIIDRKPYFAETEDIVRVDFDFRPVEGERAIAYHIADAHNEVDLPVKSARAFENMCGKLDFLIMNGDIPNHSGDISYFDNIYEIAQELTHGNIPIVFSRGNHDLRGIYAEDIAEYTPCENGNSFYSFRIGNIWGIALDCGEDKNDDHPEYGNTICCHAFRKRETRYLKHLVENASKEYNSPGIKHKIVVVHNPFTYQQEEPFNIEEDLYREWLSILKNDIKPEVMICGHTHALYVNRPGCERDSLGQACVVVEGSKPEYENNKYSAVGYIFDNDGIEAVFNDSDGNLIMREKI